MNSFLKDAERKQVMSQVEKTRVADIKDIALQVEDLIDEYMYHMYRNQHFTLIHRIFRIPKTLWEKHQIASKLQQINKTIKSTDDRSQRYTSDVDGSTDPSNLVSQRIDLAIFMKEDEVVGFENESWLLKTWLMDENEHLTLISVVGMGGSGKTTLVAKTYNYETVKSHFQSYAKITISQTYTIDNVLRSLIKEFHKEKHPDNLDTKSFSELVNILYEYLEDKKYLVFFDDVWDTNLWEVIKVALPDNHLGSRIMLTTRNEDVASFSAGVERYVIQIKPLKESEAWQLFCMKAFSIYPDKSCPNELQDSAMRLVKKCNGLPLAVSALGGLMSSKNSTEWSSVCDSLNWWLNNKKELEVVKVILLRSFDDLAYPLKHCFLYCCLFPEDHEIRRKRLIRLWIAEGFLQKHNRITLAEVADNYLKELIFRSMLQVVRRNEFGRPKACKMHDILREIALSISERENFCTVYNGQVVTEECEPRRLSIQTTDVDSEAYKGIGKLRSLFVFTANSSCFSTELLSKSKLLRVLDLEDVRIEKLPDGLETLFNLRYLNLKGTQVQELPQCIGKLGNLETLNLRDTQIKQLPKGVAKLKNLQNLIMYRYTSGFGHDFQYVTGTRVPFKMNKLKKLQVMSFVEAEGDVIRQLGKMSQLARMGISNLRSVDEVDLCFSIQNLKLLSYLFLMARDEEEFLRLDALKTPPPKLHTLILVGKLASVPRWFCSLQLLTSLYLHWSRLMEDLLPHIAALPNLGRLTLINSFAGEHLHFCSGFAKLEILHLCNLPQLKLITIEKGVMPHIRELFIDYCLALNAVPQGIEFLTNLQNLGLFFCSPTLRRSMQYEESKDYSKVQHIPNVMVFEHRG